MSTELQLLDSGLRAWKINVDRIGSFFAPLSDERLEQEVAPGRNRLRYVWGHLTAVNDAMLPLLAIGPRLRSGLDAMFLSSPDRAVSPLPSRDELQAAWTEVNGTLWDAFSTWTAADWLRKHTAVTDEEFLREPHRNRYSLMLNRAAHMAFHHGQAILTMPRAGQRT